MCRPWLRSWWSITIVMRLVRWRRLVVSLHESGRRKLQCGSGCQLASWPPYFRHSSFRPSYFRPSYFWPSYFRPSYFWPSYFRHSSFRPSYFRLSCLRPSYFRPACFRPSCFRPSYFRPSYFRPSCFRPSWFRRRASVFGFALYLLLPGCTRMHLLLDKRLLIPPQ